MVKIYKHSLKCKVSGGLHDCVSFSIERGIFVCSPVRRSNNRPLIIRTQVVQAKVEQGYHQNGQISHSVRQFLVIYMHIKYTYLGQRDPKIKFLILLIQQNVQFSTFIIFSMSSAPHRFVHREKYARTPSKVYLQPRSQPRGHLLI